jgi:hypothetical protein
VISLLELFEQEMVERETNPTIKENAKK